MITPSKHVGWHLLLLVLFTTVVASYIVVRYDALWGENDMAVLGELIETMVWTETLIPPNAYTQGYGYPVISTFLIKTMGVETAEFQMLIVPLLVGWLVLPAWLFYRELLRDENGATLATCLFLVQPEVLFVLLRSSHEKFTRGLMLFGFYLLLRSFRTQDRIGRFAALVVGFYLTCYALITFNNLIAISYIVGTGLAVLILQLLRPLIRTQLTKRFFQRFIFTLTSLVVIAFLFTFFLYQPALLSLSIFDNMVDRLSILFLSAVSTADNFTTSNPYNVINVNWPNVTVYLLISIANWLMLAVSGLLWIIQSVQLLLRRSELSLQNAFLWSLFTAFAILTAGGILIDFTGYLGANLQLRIFPAFSMLAAPLVAQWWRTPTRLQGFSRRAYSIAGGIVILSLALLSTIKATNEPTVSNYWMFATQSELEAVDWIYTHVETGELWTGYSERLDRVYRLYSVDQPKSSALRRTYRPSQASTLLLSEVMQLRSQRIGLPLLIASDDLRVYDNGSAEVYYRRPVAPYER